MTKSERIARFDAFCSNDDNFVAVEYNDPRAVAMRAEADRKGRAKEKRLAPVRAAAAAHAASIQVGQSVKIARKLVFGTVTAVDGETITVAITQSSFLPMPAGAERRFAAASIEVR